VWWLASVLILSQQERQISVRRGPLSYNRCMLDKDLLDILVCPACKLPLEYRQNPETLKCAKCHRVYKIEENIPNMLIDEATIEP
jgi:uncharacterized protein